MAIAKKSFFLMSLLALYIHRQVCISSIIISFPRPQRRKVSVSAHAIQICTYRLVQTRAYRLVGTRLDVHTRAYRFVGTDLNVHTRVYKFARTDLYVQARVYRFARADL